MRGSLIFWLKTMAVGLTFDGVSSFDAGAGEKYTDPTILCDKQL